MKRIWITLLFTIFAIISIFAGNPVNLTDSSKQLKDSRQSDTKEKKPQQVIISHLRSEILENDILLKWETSGGDSLKSFKIERIFDKELVEAGEIKPGELEIYDGEYDFNDPISVKERAAGEIVYRISAVDSSGEIIVWKQIVVQIVDEFTGYSLNQNYPNPFNPVTTIEYSIPEQKHITIKVYNILGNHIATLVDETKPAGSYKSEFNGTGLTSGVYMYTLQAGEYSETKRMILMK